MSDEFEREKAKKVKRGRRQTFLEMGSAQEKRQKERTVRAAGPNEDRQRCLLL